MAIKKIVRKDANGRTKVTYEANFYYRDKFSGKLIRKRKQGFLTMGAAKKFNEDFLFEMENSVDISFGTLVSLYLEDCRARLKPTTVENKKNIVELRILPFFEELPITEITPLHIRKWQTNLLNDEKN